MEFKNADRKDTRIKIGISGGAGAGKTKSAGLLAKGLQNGDMSYVGYIQTEPGRAQCYLDLGPFKVLEMSPPTPASKYIEAIEVAEKAGIRVLIIDSLSDEWNGVGGSLDMHSAACEVTKNSFTAWKKITPLHEALFHKILSSPIHIICTMRQKSEYVLEAGANGKTVPKRIGVKDIQREGTEYRWMLQFNLDQENNLATVVKDNTSLFQGKPPFKITEDTGKLIRSWCLGDK